MDDIGKMLGGGSGGPDLAGAIGGLVGGQGGLQRLVEQLTRGGLGDAVSSWIGSGPNQDVSPAALRAALGEERVTDLASRSGLSVDAFLPMLAGALPAIVDKVTPNGVVPDGDATAGVDLGGLLGGAMGGSDSPLGTLGGLLGGSKD